MVQGLFIVEVIVVIGCKQEVDFAFFGPICPEEAWEAIKSSLFDEPLHFYWPFLVLRIQGTGYYPCSPIDKPANEKMISTLLLEKLATSGRRRSVLIEGTPKHLSLSSWLVFEFPLFSYLSWS